MNQINATVVAIRDCILELYLVVGAKAASLCHTRYCCKLFPYSPEKYLLQNSIQKDVD